MNEREKFKSTYTKTISDENVVRKYWIFKNYNSNRNITYYTLEVNEIYEDGNCEKVYKYRGIKDLKYAKKIAENYKSYMITKKDQNNFYSSIDMRGL